MDIQKSIQEIIDKVQSDKSFASDFSKDPVKTVESVLGVDLPDDQVQSVVDGVKAKLSLDKGGNVMGKIKGLFGK
ncbi:MAG: hypothetical protein JW780_05140 [Clostridiales bacterium]|nr:hypothetical protein [Clostridiales bacterium]